MVTPAFWATLSSALCPCSSMRYCVLNPLGCVYNSRRRNACRILARTEASESFSAAYVSRRMASVVPALAFLRRISAAI